MKVLRVDLKFTAVEFAPLRGQRPLLVYAACAVGSGYLVIEAFIFLFAIFCIHLRPASTHLIDSESALRSLKRGAVHNFSLAKTVSQPHHGI